MDGEPRQPRPDGYRYKGMYFALATLRSNRLCDVVHDELEARRKHPRNPAEDAVYWEQSQVPPRLSRGLAEEAAHQLYRHSILALVGLHHLYRRGHERSSQPRCRTQGPLPRRFRHSGLYRLESQHVCACIWEDPLCDLPGPVEHHVPRRRARHCSYDSRGR